MSLSPAKQKFVDLAAAKYGEGAVLEMAHVTRVREENNLGLVAKARAIDILCLCPPENSCGYRSRDCLVIPTISIRS